MTHFCESRPMTILYVANAMTTLMYCFGSIVRETHRNKEREKCLPWVELFDDALCVKKHTIDLSEMPVCSTMQYGYRSINMYARTDVRLKDWCVHDSYTFTSTNFL
ncbi:hypothetical protein GQX74_005220 [Glossina fuscipes]|nr:hypothetical protein GQX74_005220 [Glossina fuscipes]